VSSETVTILLTIILAVQTATLIVVAVYLAITARKVRESTVKLDSFLDEVSPKIIDAVDGLNDFVKSCQPVGEQLVDISLNLRDIVEEARGTSRDISDFLQETTAAARKHVSKIDNVLADSVKRVESVTVAITDNLMNPLLEITSIIKGFRAAIGYLRGERPARSYPRSSPEEEMLI